MHMDIHEIKERYINLDRMINDLLHQLSFAFTDRVIPPAEIELEIQKMVSNKELLNTIFIEFLKLLGFRQLKYIDINDLSHEKSFNVYIHKIINSICNNRTNTLETNEYYKCHLIAFYIIFSELAERTLAHEFWNPAQLYFFEGLYRDIKFLKTLFLKKIIQEKFPGEDFSSLPFLIKNGSRERLDINLGIRNLLYSGTILSAPSTDLPNMSIFIIRSHIENWLRDNFKAYTCGSEFIPISAVFNTLKQYANEIRNDPVASTLNNIDKHINTLSSINTWSNLYVHSLRRPFFWVPHIIFKYINFLEGECLTSYCKVYGTVHLYPPFIPNQAEIYPIICDGIKTMCEGSCRMPTPSQN